MASIVGPRNNCCLRHFATSTKPRVIQESLMIVLFRPVPRRLTALLWPGLMCAAGIAERPIAPHAARAAALFTTSAAAALRFLFFTFNDDIGARIRPDRG